jgi:hypothetical protein
LQELKRECIRQRVTERKKARTLPELLAVAKERGYSTGWAHRAETNAARRYIDFIDMTAPDQNERRF